MLIDNANLQATVLDGEWKDPPFVEILATIIGLPRYGAWTGAFMVAVFNAAIPATIAARTIFFLAMIEATRLQQCTFHVYTAIADFLVPGAARLGRYVAVRVGCRGDLVAGPFDDCAGLDVRERRPETEEQRPDAGDMRRR